MNIIFSRADYFQSETLNTHKSYENYNDDQELKQYCILWWSSDLALGFHVSKKTLVKPLGFGAYTWKIVICNFIFKISNDQFSRMSSEESILSTYHNI